MNDRKRLFAPIVIIFLSALLAKLISRFLTFSFTPILLTIVIVAALFLFGMVLNRSKKRRNSAVIKKVIAILIVVILMLMQMGFVKLPMITDTFDFFGVDSFFINMIYIYCGYLFAD